MARHRVAVAGWVTDEETGQPVPGAAVTITAMPEAFVKVLKLVAMQFGKRWPAMPRRADKTQTRDDGLFYFMDLPNGKYTFSVSSPVGGKRYADAQENAIVARDNQGNLKTVTLKPVLRPTTVKGKITGPNHRTGVFLAEVRVKGSGERTFSDAQGQYVLAAIEPGARTIQVFAQGYQAASHVVKLPGPGASETLNLVLTREAG
jgi:hypothetical protein